MCSSDLEGWGLPVLDSFTGDADLSWHLIENLVEDEFDIVSCQKMLVDHGFAVPMALLWPGGAPWPVKTIPISVNTVQHPLPSPSRCYRLGQAIGRAIESYPKDLRVVVLGTGGLSHQLDGERAGFNNSDWDREFLRRFENDPEGLAEMSVAELATWGGYEGAEIMMWLILRGALSSQVRKLHEAYYLPSMTGIAVAVYENLAAPPRGEAQRRHRRLAIVAAASTLGFAVTTGLAIAAVIARQQAEEARRIAEAHPASVAAVRPKPVSTSGRMGSAAIAMP